MKYRKRPIEIDAVQVDGRWFRDDVPQHTLPVPANNPAVCIDHTWRMVYIRTLEGTMRAKVGDWLIKGIAGEIYPCADSIFRKTYELAHG